MKVIARVSVDTYICEVNHSEVEKFLNLYHGKKERLIVGDVIDLGKGYDFAKQTQEAFNKTEAFIESNSEIIRAIIAGITICSRKEKEK
jgi:hypothetical protein